MKNIVIFGASGDLARRYLIPAIEKLKLKDNKIRLIGYGRSNPNWQKDIFITGDYKSEGLAGLVKYYQPGTVYYVSLPILPEILVDLIAGLKVNKIFNSEDKIVLEKPFGTDYKSAKVLADLLDKETEKNQVYLVDHYLNKDLIRNIFFLRFSNIIFKSVWRKELIESIEIVAQEEVGIENRGEYYDKSGATRDMVQNHLLQILCLVCMDKPENKFNLLEDIVISNAKLGQYSGYKKEVNVLPESKTETRIELDLKINNKDWLEVPIKIITGKKMGSKKTFVKINFKKIEDYPPNQIIISVYPENELQLVLNPGGQTMRLSASEIGPSHDAYENVLESIFKGERLYTPTTEEILAQWIIVDKILAEYGGSVEEY